MTRQETQLLALHAAPEAASELAGVYGPGARGILDAIGAVAVVLGSDGRVALTNRAWDDAAERRGGTRESVGPGVDYLAVCERSAEAAPTAGNVLAGLRGVLVGDTITFEMEYALDGPGGTRWCRVEATRLAPGGALVRHLDVTDARLLELELRRRSTQDGLTGLANRNQFVEQTRLALWGLGDVGVAVCDLDEFKVVNQLHGDTAGDELLVQVAARLRATAHPEDLVARLGGDTFAVLCPDLDDAHGLAERLADALTSAPFEVAGRSVSLSASFGIRAVGRERCSAEEAVRDADTALHDAKRAGHRQARVFDEDVARAARRRVRLERALHEAAESADDDGHLGFHLVYQPQVDLTTGDVVGLEALLRWDLDGESVSPVEFIPIAEEIGTIGVLGSWVVQEACRQMAAWRALGLARPVGITVNLSPRQLADERLVGHVEECLSRYEIVPAHFCLELTESALMLGGDVTRRVLEQLRSTGLRVGIDDFGTGYSSLGQLRSLPVDVLKIDQSFVVGLGSEDDAAAIVHAVIALAGSMRLRVVAEGVETAVQTRELLGLGCNVVQGWLFAPGLPALRVPEVLRAGFADELPRH